MSQESRISEKLSGLPGWEIVDGIPRQVTVYSPRQTQTADIFGYKWSRRESYESEHFDAFMHDWLVKKYHLPISESWEQVISGRRILDAGCGSSLSALALFGDHLKTSYYLGVDISESVEVARQRFESRALLGDFLQASILDLPQEVGTFDVIFSEGVLHHTDSTEEAIKYLSRFLKVNGLFVFYVYSKKAPIREYVDDMIRAKISELSDEEAWNALTPLTLLGKTLGEMNQTVVISEDIKLLEIPAGEYNLQRLFYYYIMKMFYREDFSIEEMNHINFDWYRPENCHRQTPEEVRRWVIESGLTVESLNVEESGISVVARRRQ
jgi:arsenite methyltransferase